MCYTVAISIRRNGSSVFVSEIWFVNFPCPNRANVLRKCNLYTRHMTLPMWINSPSGNIVINDVGMPTYACGFVACQSAGLCGSETAW
jgi:hypothetical protein